MNQEICDKCGKEIVDGQARYGIPGISRHWSCHKTTKEVLADMEETINRAKENLAILQRKRK